MTEDDLQNTINVAKKAIELLEDDEEKELENVCH
jgi:DNA-binding XRE family transcriptional regulator